MPETEVILFREDDGTIPLGDWLDGLNAEARFRCFTRVELLKERGHDLRRPHAEYLEGTDLYELRVKCYRINYRMLYFFHGRKAAIVTHGFAKEGKIPPREIKLATDRMERFKADPEKHSYRRDG